jgi:hypothetical protein
MKPKTNFEKLVGIFNELPQERRTKLWEHYHNEFRLLQRFIKDELALMRLGECDGTRAAALHGMLHLFAKQIEEVVNSAPSIRVVDAEKITIEREGYEPLEATRRVVKEV